MALGKMAKLSLAVAVVGIGLGVAGANSAALKGLYQDIFPTDQAHRMALQICFLQDHHFNRLDSADREACYRHALLPANSDMAAAEPAPPPGGINFVDLKRVSDQGRMPANDIRMRAITETAQAN